MRELLQEVQRWHAAGQRVALATVIQAYGSAPRPMGSKMAVSSTGQMAGSVSGGCVEGAVLEEARAVLKSGEPKRLRFGITDEQAWSVGLSCGGQIEVFLEVSEPSQLLRESLEADELVAVATVVGGPRAGQKALVWPDGRTAGELVPAELYGQARSETLARLQTQTSGGATVEAAGDTYELFIEVYSPPAKLVVVGAVHVAIPLVSLARTLGFRTVVVDARSVFATPERFAHADELIVRWPADALREMNLNEGTFVVFLTHDAKLDNPALQVALESPARYIGALGSKKTHAKRVEELQKLGVSPSQIRRIHAPIGLDLGGRQPEEIALAIVAEIVAVTHGRVGSAMQPAS